MTLYGVSSKVIQEKRILFSSIRSLSNANNENQKSIAFICEAKFKADFKSYSFSVIICGRPSYNTNVHKSLKIRRALILAFSSQKSIALTVTRKIKLQVDLRDFLLAKLAS